MGNCRSEIIFPDSNNNFFLKCNSKSAPKVEEIFLSIVKIQAVIRGWLTRRKYKSFFEINREQTILKTLNEYSKQILSSRHLNYPNFDYSSYIPKTSTANLSFGKLETADSKIKYYGEWSFLFYKKFHEIYIYNE